MGKIRNALFLLLAALAALPASASFHLWAMTEIYSNADGSVQFLELRALTGAQEFVANHTLKASSGGVTHTFTIPSNLVGDSSGRSMLIGTQGFAALGVVAPDFTVPNGFFFTGGGTVDWGEGSDVWAHGALPTDGNNSLNRDGSASPNSPRNYAGQTGHVSISAPPPTPTPAVSLSGDQIDFGTVVVGDRSPSRAITLVSSGNAAYRVTALTSTPGDCSGPPMCSGSDFACSSTCAVGADIAPGTSCNISATFAPTAAGSRSATINVCDNVGGGRSLPLPLKGTGAAAVEVLNVQALWYAAPAESEAGWGLNLTQQGDIVFATWFTYDTDGAGLWLVMSDGRRQPGTNTYQGSLFSTTGPAFSSATFDPARVHATAVGSATLAFTDGNHGSFTYTVNNVTQTKAITRQLFATPPTCAEGATPGAAPNFSDLWWRSPANSESGWGVNVAHQGDILFVTWFTYDATGRGIWLVGSDVRRTAPNTYSGQLFRTTGPVFSATPWSPAQVKASAAGSATFTFSDANNGTFAYTLDGVSQSKPITRQVFSTPATVCR